MTHRRRLATVLLAGAAMLAGAISIRDGHAQVFRCERDGKISYSDQACQVGEIAAKKSFQTTATTGSLEIEVDPSFYPVTGLTLRSLVQSLRTAGPNGYQGLAKWQVTKTVSVRHQHDAQDTCSISDVRVRISGSILMPRWDDERLAPVDLQRRWASAYAALQRHEEGHIQHGREFALLVKERLLGLGAMPCDRIEATAESEYLRIYSTVKNRDADYDARTQHGLTQGTDALTAR